MHTHLDPLTANSKTEAEGTGFPSFVILLLAVVSLAVTVQVTAPECAAQEVFTNPYLVQSRNPSCMGIFIHTSTNLLKGVWVRWGYEGDDLRHTQGANPVHQNIKNETCKSCAAEDFVRWDAWICAEPGMRVYYKFLVSYDLDWDDGNAVATYLGNFTLPLHPAARHLTFFGYGDTRDCGDDFEKVTKEIRSVVEDDPNNNKTFLLHTGDVVYNGGRTHFYYDDNNWMDYFSGYDASKRLLKEIPVVIALGNHDFSWDGHSDDGPYPKYFFTNFPYPQYLDSVGKIPHLDSDGTLDGSINQAYYSFDYGPVHVSVLNSYHSNQLEHLGGCTIGVGLEPGYKQHAWLAQDLASTDKPWKIIMMHVPTVSCDCDMYSSPAARHGIEDLVLEYGVDIVLAGHDHNYAKCYYNEIPHLVLGGGGAELYNPHRCLCDWVQWGVFFHYARFDVDAHQLTFAVYEPDGNDWVWADGRTMIHDEPLSDEVTFETSFTSTDYRNPIRFTCTTKGKHFQHQWDLGDGTTSTQPNPYHGYPRPTDPSGYQHYTPTLKVSDSSGHNWVSGQKDMEVYIGGTLEIDIGDDVGSETRYALFLTPPDEAFDENRDFWGVVDGDDNIDLDRLRPGSWTVTVRPLGYDERQGVETLEPDDWKLVRDLHPVRNIDFDSTTIAIGSVPEGADVTVTYWDGYENKSVTGTTPFYADVCCAGSNNMYRKACTYDWEVKNGDVEAEGTGDLETIIRNSNCQNYQSDGLSQVYADVRKPPEGEAAGEQLRLHILSEPSDQRIVKKGSARIEIHARSKDSLTYRWYKGRSGDTSRPIHGATGPVFVTPKVHHQKKYWVRVHVGHGPVFVDSRTATVEVVDQGPRITGPDPLPVCPGVVARLQGSGFNATDPQDNRVFFGEQEVMVREVDENGIEVEVPGNLAEDDVVEIRLRANDVWSKSINAQVVMDWRCEVLTRLQEGE